MGFFFFFGGGAGDNIFGLGPVTIALKGLNIVNAFPKIASKGVLLILLIDAENLGSQSLLGPPDGPTWGSLGVNIGLRDTLAIHRSLGLKISGIEAYI